MDGGGVSERCWNTHRGPRGPSRLLLRLAPLLLSSLESQHTHMQGPVAHHVQHNAGAVNHQAQESGDDPQAEEHDRGCQLEEEHGEKCRFLVARPSADLHTLTTKFEYYFY